MTAEQKLGVVCGSLVLGESIALFAGLPLPPWPLLACVVALVAMLGFGYRWRLWPVACCLLIGLTLATRANRTQKERLQAVKLQQGRYEASLIVEDNLHVGKARSDGLRWMTFTTSRMGEKLNVVIHLNATNAIPRLGETWHCAGFLDTDDQPSGHIRTLWVQGRRALAYRERTARTNPIWSMRARVKRDLSRRMGIGLEDCPDIADLNRAMVLGDRAAISSEAKQNFVRSGTLHVFAISGLHVAVIAQILVLALVVLAFPVRWAGVVLLPALWLYVWLIGMPPSAMRAAAMASVYYAAPIFWRRPNAMTAWEVTLIGFALLDPIGLFGVGSMLSFTVVFGILLFARWARSFKSRWIATLGFPFAAWASGLPIAAHVFARITPGGLFANLIEVPLASGAVLTSVLGVAASFVSDRLAAHVNNLAALMTKAMTGVSWAVAHLPGADFEIMPWSLAMCAGWYVGIILLFVWIKMVWSRRRHAITY